MTAPKPTVIDAIVLLDETFIAIERERPGLDAERLQRTRVLNDGTGRAETDYEKMAVEAEEMEIDGDKARGAKTPKGAGAGVLAEADPPQRSEEEPS